jgi:membrane-associated phospholipid phosphatase
MTLHKKNCLLKCFFIVFCICFLHHNASSQNWDIDLLKSINQNPPASKLWRGISATAEPLSLSIPIALYAVGMLDKNQNLKEQSIEVIGGFALTTIVTEGLKIIVNRQRPYEKYRGIYPYKFEKGQSFPSGHTAIAFSTATSLAILYKRWYIVAPAYLWATCVSYSRLYLGQHYPSDILAAAIVGSGSAWLSHKGNQWLKKKRRHKRQTIE